jgi:hypothetical protein
VKNQCLNVWKAIAAFFVVFIHCSFPSPVGGMMNGLARFAVPLFFMISGYFCYGKGMDTVSRRVRRTFQLFLTANGVYFLWKLLALASEKSLTIAAVADLFAPSQLWNWLVWNQSPFMGHLWFLGALLYCYLFYGLLVKHGWEKRLYLLIPICLGANLILGEGLAILGRESSFLYVRNFWLTGLPFFLWGHWFAGNREENRYLPGTGACFGIVLSGACLSMVEMLVSGGAELYLGSILMAGGIFAWAIKHPDFGKGSLAARIGERDSLHIYLWQMILYDITAVAAYRGGFREYPLYQWLMPLWVCLLSWAAAELIENFKRRRTFL